MADILIRASDRDGGVGRFCDEGTHFYRGNRLKDVAQGDRVYFVAKGTDHGQPKGTGAIIAYALGLGTFQDYSSLSKTTSPGSTPKQGKPKSELSPRT